MKNLIALTIIFIGIPALLALTESKKPWVRRTGEAIFGLLGTVLIAPFMLLLVFGMPLLTLGCIYFLFTTGNFDYAIGALFFSVISFAMWAVNEDKISNLIHRKKPNE